MVVMWHWTVTSTLWKIFSGTKSSIICQIWDNILAEYGSSWVEDNWITKLPRILQELSWEELSKEMILEEAFSFDNV